MNNAETLKITAQGERELLLSRAFGGPPRHVFDALTQPELVQHWLLGGPPGWTMPVCEIDLRVGGTYRYVWRNDSGNEMGMGGVYREIVPGRRLVQTESFDQKWYPGDALITTELAGQGSGTKFTATILYESHEARNAVLKSRMEQGVAASYDRLKALLEAIAHGG